MYGCFDLALAVSDYLQYARTICEIDLWRGLDLPPMQFFLLDFDNAPDVQDTRF
jgi:hypothetical protein